MTDFLKLLLVSHVVLGLLGVAAFYACWMWLLKAAPPAGLLRKASLKGALFFVLSWFAGGYYYATYYGTAVKDVIKKGQYPWAHSVFMEAKEHIFLFLPFLAITLAVVLAAAADGLEKNRPVKSAAALLAGTIAILGIIITLAGATISGAVR